MASQVFQASTVGQYPVEIYEAVVKRLSSHCQWAGKFEQEELVYERGVLDDSAIAVAPGLGNTRDDDLLRLRRFVQADGSESDVVDGQEPVSRDLSWQMHILRRPEPPRARSEVSIRSVVSCAILGGNAQEFVSSLGFRPRFAFRRKGLLFLHGPHTTIQMYQIMSLTPDSSPSKYRYTPLTSGNVLEIISEAVVPPNRPSPQGPGMAPGEGGAGGSPGGDVAQQTQKQHQHQQHQHQQTTQEIFKHAVDRVKEVKDILKGLVDVTRVDTR